jgi:hypothetical protein
MWGIAICSPGPYIEPHHKTYCLIVDQTIIFELNGARIRAMKLKNTAFLMIIWFFCQQAGAVVSSVVVSAFQNESSPVSQSSMSCHKTGETEHATDTFVATGAHHHGETVQMAQSSDLPGQKCCDFECQCCIGGCLSMLGDESSQTTLALSFHPNSYYWMVFPQTPAHSLFRPPIVH